MLEPNKALADVTDFICSRLKQDSIQADYVPPPSRPGGGEPWKNLIHVQLAARVIAVWVVLIRKGPKKGLVYVERYNPEEFAFNPADIATEGPKVVVSIKGEFRTPTR